MGSKCSVDAVLVGQGCEMQFNYVLTLASRCVHSSLTHVKECVFLIMFLWLNHFPLVFMIFGSPSMFYFFPFFVLEDAFRRSFWGFDFLNLLVQSWKIFVTSETSRAIFILWLKPLVQHSAGAVISLEQVALIAHRPSPFTLKVLLSDRLYFTTLAFTHLHAFQTKEKLKFIFMSAYSKSRVHTLLSSVKGPASDAQYGSLFCT